MAVLTRKIEVGESVYTLRVPRGPLGARQFAIITKMAPTGPRETEVVDGIEVPIMSPGDTERMNEAFIEWSEQILPKIFVEGTFKPEEMPGMDQFALFLAVTEIEGEGMEGKTATSLFRIVPEGS